MDRPTVVIELADDPKLARDISAGGVFVPGCNLKINSDCALLVRGPAEEIELAARVVYVDARTGAGLELVGFTPALRDHLTRLMTSWSSVDVEPVPAAAEPAPVEATSEVEAAASEPLDLGFDPTADAGTPVEAASEEAAAPPGEEVAAPPAALDDAAAEAELTDEERADPEKRKRALTLHQRLRGLTLAQQVKIAQTGDPQERMVLERYYNKNVWEPLLRNPRLTPPEVTRIARMGTLPRVLLEIIVGNGAWIQIPEIRRALLANPRLGTDQILRVLRMLPKHELKLASTQTAYPYAVRDAAKRLLKDQVGGGG